MNFVLQHMKIGFLGFGNMSQAIVKGLLESKLIKPEHIYATNRSEGKLQKARDIYKIQTLPDNESLIEKCDLIILATKPQDLKDAVDPIASLFNENQIVLSLAAGVTLNTLQKKLSQCRIARVMPNTPSTIGRGVIGYTTAKKDQALCDVIDDLLTPLGQVIEVENEEELQTLMISCASGTGFVFELMTYWQDWIEEHGFETKVAKMMTVETFLGAALLAAQSNDLTVEDLLAKVTSKKGTTSAGLESMRELEIERALRYSFEKACLRNQELAKLS